MSYEIGKINYVPGKMSKDMKPGDTIYIQKTVTGGCSASLYCEILSIAKGIVTAKVLEYTPDWVKRDFEGATVTTRFSKCYLWDKDGCHWFGRDLK